MAGQSGGPESLTAPPQGLAVNLLLVVFRIVERPDSLKEVVDRILPWTCLVSFSLTVLLRQRTAEYLAVSDSIFWIVHYIGHLIFVQFRLV